MSPCVHASVSGRKVSKDTKRQTDSQGRNQETSRLAVSVSNQVQVQCKVINENRKSTHSISKTKTKKSRKKV